MEKDSNIFKISKKTIKRVIIFHIVIIIAIAIPYKSFKKEKKNNLTVNNITVQREIKQKVVQRVPLKKQVVQKAQNPVLKQANNKASAAKNHLLNKLENQIQNLDKPKTNITKKNDLLVPKNIKSIDIDKKIINENTKNVSNYKQLLLDELQSNLKLLEYGDVKVSFVIHPTGDITDIVILDSKSEINQKYLKNNLAQLQFKNVNKMFLEKQKFIVIFKNE